MFQKSAGVWACDRLCRQVDLLFCIGITYLVAPHSPSSGRNASRRAVRCSRSDRAQIARREARRLPSGLGRIQGSALAPIAA